MEYIKTVCKVGQGALCCRYLGVGLNGYQCDKHSPLRVVIDARADYMVSKGDNCPGFDRKIPLNALNTEHLQDQPNK